MTQILSPTNIKNRQQKSILEAKERVKKLSLEEDRVNKSLNLAKSNAIYEKEALFLLSEKLKSEHKTTVKKLSIEVIALEDRRKDALKPIREVMKKADSMLEGAKLKEVEIKKDRKDLSDIKKENNTRKKELKVMEKDIEKTTNILDKRQDTVEENEKELGANKAILNLEREKFNKEKLQKEKILNDKKKAIDSQTKINKIVTKDQEKRAIDLNNKDRAIRDKYNTLQRTINRLKND